ncbi:imelysin [Stutzerimonas nosocomialis]|uniref:imelysin family protein n=1 Tax=Stutzerimonas nosocomialis TaxID=1056496 RepID=UPI001107D2A8|nr:imelysin family protein [Stutzerimonas nosocomialis]TLX53240.1 imelysin [Stutzerimonas nosocomialis]TLX56273.1 imelysin [Stutzerimonas nosocomialis]
MNSNRNLRALCLAWLAAAALVGCSQPEPMERTSAAVADGVLLPAYREWAETNRRLAASAHAFCAGNETLEEARQAYVHAQLAWAGLQPLLIGPMGEGNLAWQVQFWPDKKNLVARQVGGLLKNKPQLTRDDVASASVVVQGLTAYEYVLFDQDIDLQDAATRSHYCPLLMAIGEHQQTLSAGIVERWTVKDGMAAQLKQFPSERYAEPSEAIAELLRVDVTALDALKKKLGTPLGRQNKGQPQPYQAEAWRSDTSLASLEAAISGAQRLWEGADRDGLRALLGDDQAGLAKRIDDAFATTHRHFAETHKPLNELLADEAGRNALNALYDDLNILHRLHQGELAQALGIQIGFNAHDGD